jgi:tryptophanyl-tRNA synthetase
LLEIFSSFDGAKPHEVAARYERYGDLKKDLADLVVTSLAPIKSRYHELRHDPAQLERLVDQGAKKAIAVAEPVYQRAAAAMGLI